MKISVIIPVYNQEKLVIRALESIPKTNDIEIIVINDGSSDNTWINLLEYQKTHSEIQNLFLVNHTKNKGVANAVNTGYELAIGEYVVLLGSDDYFTKKFEKIIKELDGTDLVYFDVEVNNGDVWQLNNESKTVLCGSFKFMRRNFIKNTRCPEERKSGEDVQFYKELLQKNPTEKFTHIVLKHYNHPRDGSLTDLVRKGKIYV